MFINQRTIPPPTLSDSALVACSNQMLEPKQRKHVLFMVDLSMPTGPQLERSVRGMTLNDRQQFQKPDQAAMTIEHALIP